MGIIPAMLQKIWLRRVRRTTLISIASVAFLAGIGLARSRCYVSLEVVAASLALLWFCRKRTLALAVPAILIIGLLAGLWRGGEVLRQVDVYASLTDHKISVAGIVAQDSTYGRQKQIDFLIDHVRVDGRNVPGQVRVTTFDPIEPKQGDHIIATTKAKPGFGNYQLGMYYAGVQIVGHDSSWIGRLRRTFSAAILNVIPEPQASLGLGFLLGIKSQLPDSLNDQLKVVGLTHIVVASGYNLTILVRAARRLLAKRSKYQATAVAVTLMIGFVAVTGFTPSMSRAALVTSLSLAAWYYGRVIHPVVLLTFSAAITGAIMPLYVWGDVGWYLSFLAFGGVMLGAPLLQKRLFGTRQAPQLVQILLETVCAEIVALPLTLLVFGSASAVAILSNVLVTPLVPVAMLLSFVAGAASLVLPGPGAWLALPAHVVLTYMTNAISWLAGIPWAKQSVSLSIAGLIAIYGCVLAIGVVLWRRTRYDYLSKGVVE